MIAKWLVVVIVEYTVLINEGLCHCVMKSSVSIGNLIKLENLPTAVLVKGHDIVKALYFSVFNLSHSGLRPSLFLSPL